MRAAAETPRKDPLRSAGRGGPLQRVSLPRARTLGRVALSAWLAAFGAAPAGRTAELYRRAIVLEDAVGRVEIRDAYGVRLTVLDECEADPRGCRETRVYDAVLRLDFALERRERGEQEVARSGGPQSTILLALSATAEDIERIRDELEAAVRRLSAEAFAEPFSGWRPTKAPFDAETISSRSLRPSWACFRSGDRVVAARFQQEVRQGPRGPEVVGMDVRSFSEPPTPLCDEMASATDSSMPRAVETLPSPRRLLEITVDHRDAVRLDPGHPEALAKLPEGVRVSKRRMPKGVTGEASGDPAEGGLPYAQRALGDGWRFDAHAEAASMPVEALDRGAWLHDWTIRTVERRLGPNPSDRLVEEMRLGVAYLATVPPEIVEGAADRSSSSGARDPETLQIARGVPATNAAAVDRAAYLEAFVSGLDRQQRPPHEVLEELVRIPAAGLRSEGWISVLCRQDGTATYFLLPTKAHNRVTNAERFCAALEARLSHLR